MDRAESNDPSFSELISCEVRKCCLRGAGLLTVTAVARGKEGSVEGSVALTISAPNTAPPGSFEAN